MCDTFVTLSVIISNGEIISKGNYTFFYEGRTRNMKKFSFQIAVIIMLALLFTAGISADRTSAATDEQLASRVYINENLYFEKDTNRYVYIVTDVDNAEIGCTVADKMIVNGPVSISFSPIYTVSLIKNGQEVDTALDNITEPGTYIVRLLGNGTVNNVLTFTIVGQNTNLTQYVLPADCEMIYCTLNQKEIPYDQGSINFKDEGIYYVEYRNTMSKQNHSFVTMVDHTSPELTFSGVTDGKAKGAVVINGIEDGDDIFVTLDGTYYEPNGNVLNTVGKYFVRATDSAGNTSEYYFDIVVALDVYTVLFLILFIILIAGLLVYLMIGRRKMKVR